ncbi:hypothetical protein GRI58_14890 [Porphyrobacter algicida]|uniref:Uncharacterized protein n=1 Tax=Qipengyuania algicida TaxID=1836209 RepID=A0A845ALQ3_9SPHN|nr:hypothetical protein [Qipengyuania algicida]
MFEAGARARCFVGIAPRFDELCAHLLELLYPLNRVEAHHRYPRFPGWKQFFAQFVAMWPPCWSLHFSNLGIKSLLEQTKRQRGRPERRRNPFVGRVAANDVG